MTKIDILPFAIKLFIYLLRFVMKRSVQSTSYDNFLSIASQVLLPELCFGIRTTVPNVKLYSKI